MLVGTLAAIRRYPVKSLQGQSLDRVEVTRAGLDGDRTSALFVERGHARAGKTYRGKEHHALHLVANPEEAAALASARGVALEHRTNGRFFDDAPISIVVDRWLDDLAAFLGYPVEPERFRANFVVRADAAFEGSEAALLGCDLLLGDVRLRVRSPIGRCVVVTYHPEGDGVDPAILRTIAERRKGWMGVVCDVLEPGCARTGDALISLR